MVSMGVSMFSWFLGLLVRDFWGFRLGCPRFVICLLTSFDFRGVGLSNLKFRGFCSLTRYVKVLDDPLRASNCLVEACQAIGRRVGVSRAFLHIPTPGRIFSNVCFGQVEALPPSNRFSASVVCFHAPFRFVYGPNNIRPTVVFPLTRFIIVGAFPYVPLVYSNYGVDRSSVGFNLFVEKQKQDFAAVGATERPGE